MTFPFGETVTQYARTRGADSDNNTVWVDGVGIDHEQTAVYPRTSTELVQGADTNIVGLTLVFKPAVTVAATDEFTVRGERWAVDGLPGQYASPFTGTTVTQIHLTRVEG